MTTRCWIWITVTVANVAMLAACGGGSSGGNSPPAATYTVGGTVSGLSGTVVLQNNGSNDLTISANGAFTFPTTLASGATYAVTVRTQPATATLAQNCTVSSGTGTLTNSNIANVTVSCATTMINGLTVPPDPGSAGLQTVTGVDSDNNGIRDDIDIFIATKYGANATAVSAARRSALTRQRVLATDATSQTAARIALQDSGDAGVCATDEFQSAGLDPIAELRELYLRTYNTPERLQQYKAVSVAGGVFTRSATSVICQ